MGPRTESLPLPGTRDRGGSERLGLPALALEQQDRHEAGEGELLFGPGAVAWLILTEPALEDRAPLLHPQDGLAAQLREVGGVEEEAAQGVGERARLRQAVEDLDEGVLLWIMPIGSETS